MTIRDVARAAGVGVSTASRALNGVPTGPRGQGAAAHVLRVAAELGYIPNHAARALRGRRTSVIVLADDPSNATTGAAIEAMERLAVQRGDFFVSAAAIGPTLEAQLATVRLAASLRPLAIVVSSTRLSDPAVTGRAATVLDEYRDAGGRVVVIGALPIGGAEVSVSNFEAGVDIGRHVVSLGRRRYGILAGIPDRPVFADRTEGFLAALDEAGVPRRDVAIEHSDHSREGGAHAAARLLAGRARPEAVLSVNDTLAFGALTTIRDAGLRVPGDIALSGIDDDPVSRDVTPSLTTVAFPFDELGVRIAQLAFAADELPDGPIIVRGRVIVRESTMTSRGR